jgi:Cu-processing system permease protein
MTRTFVIASNTAREIFRDRILYGLLIFAVLLIFMSLLLGELSFSEQARIITDMGLVAAELGCGMLAIFIGSSLVWRELERQTVLTLLSKPVKRTEFLIGKFLGLAWVLLIVDILISLFLAMICLFFGKLNLGPFIVSELGVLAESLLLLSMTLFFGVFCRPILTTLFTLCMWLLGHGTDDLYFFANKSHNTVLHYIGIFASRVIPNLNAFTFKEAVVYGDVIPQVDIIKALILWIAWSAILLISASLIFKKRDFI